ncbi:MAG: hypothetical protein WCN95_05940 [bacterium]
MNTLLYDGSSGRVPISSEKLILINPVLFMAFAIIAAPFTPLAHAQNTITGSVTHAVRGSKPARLSVAALCAQLTLDEVTAIMGDNFERRPESEGKPQVCEYSDRLEKGKMKVRYFTLGNSILTESGWQNFVETEAKGQVIQRDGVLVSHLRKHKFGTDSIWFKDRKGHALELNVNSGITEDQAVALAKAAMD